MPNQFNVTALTISLPEYKHLHIVPSDAIILGIYSKVFGPASYQECEKWVAAHSQYNVISLTAALPSYQKCNVVPAESMIIGIYSKVFGPDTYPNCEKWKNDNCGK